MYVVKHEKFEGPLDLLLELIQKEKLSINEISLSAVTDAYVRMVEALSKEQKIDQEELAEFLVVAGELLLIKSRSLLPQYAATPEEQASAEELEHRLAELAQMRDRAKELKEAARLRRFIFSREPYSGFAPVFYPPRRLDLGKLPAAFLRMYDVLPKIEKLAEEKIKKIISLEEKIQELRQLLSAKIDRAFSEIIRGGKEKVEVIVSFLALLELAKEKLVELQQDVLFGEIRIHGTPERR